MYLILLVALTILASASTQIFGPEGYHIEIGIPRAEKIKAIEDALEQTSRNFADNNATANEYPYFAGLLIHLKKSTALSSGAATLLTKDRLVTAAHCWNDGKTPATKFTVVLGSKTLYTGGTRLDTDKIHVHPEYSPDTLNNDIAIIDLPKSVSFSETIFPVAIPQGKDSNKTFESFFATAVGYCQSAEDAKRPFLQKELEKVELRINTYDECAVVFKGAMRPSLLCTESNCGVGLCVGGTGGPLVAYTDTIILVGISSYAQSLHHNHTHECDTGLLNGYTRVTQYLDFIKSLVKIPGIITIINEDK